MERAEREAAEAQATALGNANKLQNDRRKAAAAVDQAAAEFVKCAQQWAGIANAQVRELRAAGMRDEVLRAAEPKAGRAEYAVCRAMLDLDSFQIYLFGALTGGHHSLAKSLVESDPAVVSGRPAKGHQ